MVFMGQICVALSCNILPFSSV